MQFPIRIVVMIALSLLHVCYTKAANRTASGGDNSCPQQLGSDLKMPHPSSEEFIHQFLEESDSLQVLKNAVQRFPELNWLSGAVDATPFAKGIADGNSLSEKIFGQKHIEFDRTATGILILKWILQGNYEAFTAPQSPQNRMTKENFQELQNYTRAVLKSPSDIEAMIVYMVINDLGKIKSIAKQIQETAGIEEIDHDNLLLLALEKYPEISPSFSRLSAHHQNLMIESLKPKFNIGQLLQAENVPASLSGLRGFNVEAMNFYLLHALADIGGVLGHVNSNGSMILDNPYYQTYKDGVAAMQLLANGASEIEAYDSFLASRGRQLGLSVSDPEERAVLRVAVMLKLSQREDAQNLREVYLRLPKNAAAILQKELNVAGIGDGFGILVYYGPAIIQNIANFVAKGTLPNLSWQEGMRIGLLTLSRLYQESRVTISKRQGSGVFTLMSVDVANLAKENPEALLESDFGLEKIGNDARVRLQKRSQIDLGAFPALSHLKEIPGRRVAVIGIGGGSDGIQAAQLAGLLKNSGKEIVFVASVRTEKTGSQGATGKAEETRTVTDHGGEISKGVFKILTATSGSGRFLENLPADRFPMYLVVDSMTGTTTQQVNTLVDQLEGVDTVIAVDTGGDSLYPARPEEGPLAAKATPDQDLRVLQSLGELRGVNVLSAVVAAGVDSPMDAQEILKMAHAQVYLPDDLEVSQILGVYRDWQMDGSREDRFGKTSLVWQLALQGKLGLNAVEIPRRIVLDSRNPWNPFVHIEASMSGIFVMPIQNHLKAIGSHRYDLP